MASSNSPEPIAIVGSGCRFPGGTNSPAALWELLENPRDVCQDIPPDRFDTRSFYHANGGHHGTTNVQQAYLLQQDIRVFDAPFFNISPHEADSIDPQQRLLLETVYEALESGGHTLESLRVSDTAVYVGTMGVDYNDMLMRDLDSLPKYAATGTNRAIISNRISYFYDWHGPSMTIDTACSSSLIAVHQGVQTLRARESRVAVACGTQVILGPEVFISESNMQMLSPSGRSRMWDADADGYGRGEGVAAIVLKRLSDAIADGDHIECIIRGTSANQDGRRSNGLTVPSSEAQAELIRRAYANAGLNPEKEPWDRPQFFEAHGTGTPAGDPKEAAAISACFGQRPESHDEPLYVGSIKTVIGHTEGAAGLAGLLKGSGMIQKGVILPNLLLNRLNPAIEPYYGDMHIPTSQQAWPRVPDGVPRRVSVNSFGFGGSNAHAILEEFRQPQIEDDSANIAGHLQFTPFVFSAASTSSLKDQLRSYRNHLKVHHDISVSNLAWTLQTRRSQLPVKVAFSATTIEQLTAKIDIKLSEADQVAGAGLGITSTSDPAAVRHILGVFTGQGAQWPAMGGQLIRSSAFARKRVQELQDSLDALPYSDKPLWRLHGEMIAGADSSRVFEAELSQPLCTAVQILLVDLLRMAGITFSAVVGHSSGEIAAAYASGTISSRDAIRIAYYRGIHARLARNTHKNCTQKGAMLAVGTSLEDAQGLIQLSAFRGRLAIAAHNSSASVTLSGDADAIIHAEKVFKEEKKFARLLKVDTAYHSHHMEPCSDPYLDSLQTCEIQVIRDRGGNPCRWFSSVEPREEIQEGLEDVYWVDNMRKTVRFMEAVNNAVTNDPQLSLILEVGPHPALKGPVTQTLSEARLPAAVSLPYVGVLSRGLNDIEAFSDALGAVWAKLGAHAVDFRAYDEAMSAGTPSPRIRPKLVVGLPSYQWNHTRAYWHESRRSRKRRQEKQRFHELLGVFSPDSTPQDLRWTNILKASEIPWLEGHRLQGQVIFPAAGFVCMALEAARILVARTGGVIELLELEDFSILRPIVFDEISNSGVETLITLTVVRHSQGQSIDAQFSCYTCLVANTGSEQELELTAKGTIKISVGTPDIETLPCTPLNVNTMSTIDTKRFYTSLSDLGYDYSGPFKTMSSLKRKLNQSSVLVDTYSYPEADPHIYLIHPTTLDVAFQASILAYSAPGDGRLWSLHVPTSIQSIRVNPEVCVSLPTSGCQVPVSTRLYEEPESLKANIDVLDEGGQYGMVQIEGLTMKPIAPASKLDDRHLFSYTKWGVATPDGALALGDARPSAYESEVAIAAERIAYYYLRRWKSEITDEEWARGQPHHARLRNYMDDVLSAVYRGQHPHINKAWSEDGEKDINELINRPCAFRYGENIDIKLLATVGEIMPAFLRGESHKPNEAHVQKKLLTFFEDGIGCASHNKFLTRMLQQITHRYPHAKVLKIGAGPGGSPKTIAEGIADTISSSTLIDSSDNTSSTADNYRTYGDKVYSMVLDMEKAPESQGFGLFSYDIVVVSHASRTKTSIEKTLENARKLIKPGGHLILSEVSDEASIRFNTIMGCFSDFWLRPQLGSAKNVQAHHILRNSGFSGVDTTSPDIETTVWPFSIITAQATDDRIDFLRKPLSTLPSPIYIERVVILGTRTLESSQIAEGVANYLNPLCRHIEILDDLPTAAQSFTLDPMDTFINLVDIDYPIFKEITAEKMSSLQRLFDLAKTILWITVGSRIDQPYHAASTAFCRAIRHEVKHVDLNNFDIAPKDLENNRDVPKQIAEHLLRQVVLGKWRESKEKPLLWSKELEVYLDEGRLLIPRLIVNAAQDARLNASRRTIIKTVPVLDANVSIPQLSPERPAAGLVEQILPPKQEETGTLLRVTSSSLMALNVGIGGFLFLSIGNDEKTGEISIALSETNCNKILPIASTIAFDADHTDADDRSTLMQTSGTNSLLLAVAGELIAAAVVEDLYPGNRVLVHCSIEDHPVVGALSRRAATKGVHIFFTCDTSCGDTLQIPDSMLIKLNARTPRHVVKALLQRFHVTHFLDLTSWKVNANAVGLGHNIAHALPLEYKCIMLSDLTRHQSVVTALSHDRDALLSRLEDAVSNAKITLRAATITPELIISPEEATAATQPASVIHWPVGGTFQVHLQPLDARDLFSREKTYLLVGLSGQIGQSLGEWMLSQGAGCICLASRSPRVDEIWLQSFQGRLKVFTTDITSIDSLNDVIAQIRATCPPIAGVANGAMVLQDGLFSGMSTEAMNRSLDPKIIGSNNLDQVFHDEPLDFFILFSSLVCVVGNPGQTNYAAANGYLNGLARKRRKRGLAATALDIGRVAGIGVVETAGKAVTDQLTRLGFLPISESDFHQMFAEAILAGYPNPSKDQDDIPEAVVTTGLQTIYQDKIDQNSQLPWLENPFLSHCIVQTGSPETRNQNKELTLAIEVQLSNATSEEEALSIIKDHLSEKMRIMLQISPDQPINHDGSILELGIDSFVGVEVRSWFLKHLKVDIPVLAIVGGASITELSQQALDKLSKERNATTDSTKASHLMPQPQVGDEDKYHIQNVERARTPSYDTSSATSASYIDDTPVRSPISDAESDPPTEPSPISKPRRFLRNEQLSFGQSRFWFLRLLLDDPTTFNITVSYQVTGNLRIDDLEKAFRIVIARHEALRTCFVPHETEPDEGCQKVLPIGYSPLRLEHRKIESPDEVVTEYTNLKAHVFDLENGDTIRIVVLTLWPSSHYLLVSYPHILMDGVSLQVLLSDLEKGYNGQGIGPPPWQYPDFSAKQRQAFARGEFDHELMYWRSVFPVDKQPLVLPLLSMARINSRLPMKKFDVNQMTVRLEAELQGRVKSVTKAQRCTPFHLYLAAFKMMLFGLADFVDADAQVDEIVIGIADANRHDSDVMGSIGFFLNLLALTFQRLPNQNFADTITEARNTTYSALKNSRLPFDVLLNELNVARSSSHSPLFQAFFDFRQGAQEKHPFGNCQFEVKDWHPGRTAYDITLDVTDGIDGADSLITIRTQSGLYDETATNLLLETYVHLLDTLTRDISLTLETMPLFGKAQISRAIEVGHGPTLKSDWPETIPHRIEDVARENKDNVAIMDDLGNKLTYSDLIGRIEAIAEAVKDSGAGPGSRVLVFQQAASDWVCSMLAILWIGATYVPLDLRNPISRLATVAASCEPSAIIVDSTTLDDVPKLGVPGASIIDLSHLSSRASKHVKISASAESIAAILYTSGSTGTPKGIMVTHSGLRNEIEGYTKKWGLGSERVLQQSSFTFNHSSDQIYTGLVNGGMVYVVSWSKRGDPIEICRLINQHSITYTKATPSEYALWLEYGSESLKQSSQWRFAFAGGEPLSKTIAYGFSDLGLSQLRLFNSYGPTEISISSTKMEVDYRLVEDDLNSSKAGDNIPCGYALPNYSKYIVDKQLNPLPVGMPGELCIGGAGVSLGYFNDPELTEQRFVTDTFASSEYLTNGWNRMYRTGDIVHIQDDGAMVFHNRIEGSTQIKIRGLRIELSDIENNIIAAAGGALREAIVTLQGEGEHQFLVAYVVFSTSFLQQNSGDPSATVKESFLEHLLSQLSVPQYMIPAVAIPLDRVPLTKHSKVDRKALTDMPLPNQTKPIISQEARENLEEHPEHLVEIIERTKSIWHEILGGQSARGIDRVLTPSSDFFLVGGNSLLAIRLQSRINRAFHVAIRLVDLLGSSTLGKMARQIQKSSGVGVIDWEKETLPPPIPQFLNRANVVPHENGYGEKIKPITVAITGATGFLGKYLLPQLVDNPEIGRIHCIAVRDKPLGPKPRELNPSEKVVYHNGDLSEPLLGLTKDEFISLSREVDVILHMGAAKSFWDSYYVLHPSNVHPTRELVKLAGPRKIPIHYISTMGTLPRDTTEAKIREPPADGSDGYVATRWVSERILERSATTLGVPSYVYRFLPSTQTTGHALLDEFVRFVDVSGKVPDMDDWEGRIDLIPAEQATQWLGESVLSSTVQTEGTTLDSTHPIGDPKTQYRSWECPIAVDVAELRAHIKNQRGNTQGGERIPGLRWLGLIKELGFGYLLASQVVIVVDRDSGNRFKSLR
ncbi:uncharacterized protein F4822DRAFT_432506 [Hypoxylon trugodes]|uniref:uncharacterized protein n=1 Tax=Hypoxylon trugodes TaxID=326681 RepID=UPI0021982454|nr:uncharacterized protein F4822DRAFT_432506 [Hypoxylon trugodes]KAI1385651.1 hypothetical protein F4822DRAFT_432506 [Hypoxylon trugodes]